MSAPDIADRLQDFMKLCSPRGRAVLQEGVDEIWRLRRELEEVTNRAELAEMAASGPDDIPF